MAGKDVDTVAAGGERGLKLIEVVRALFEGDDPLELRQLGDKLRRHVDAGPLRHVVEEDRDLGRVGDRLEIGFDLALADDGVIGRHDEDAVAAGFFRRLRQLGGLARHDRGRPADDRDAGTGSFARQAEKLQPLLRFERPRFAGTAADRDAVGALGDEQLDIGFELHLVDRAVTCEGRRDGDEIPIPVHLAVVHRLLLVGSLARFRRRSALGRAAPAGRARGECPASRPPMLRAAGGADSRPGGRACSSPPS